MLAPPTPPTARLAARAALAALAALALASCGGSGSDPPPPGAGADAQPQAPPPEAPDAAPTPTDFDDALIELGALTPTSLSALAVEDVALDGALAAYCGADDGVGDGVVIVDVNDPATPAELGFIELAGCRRLALRGDELFVTSVADRFGDPVGTLAIYDLSTVATAAPTLLASLSEPGSAFAGLAVADDLVYVAAAAGGVRVFERAAASLSARGTVPGADPDGVVSASDVVARGQTLYVADAGAGIGAPAGLVTIDIGDPDAPRVIGRAEAAEAAPAAIALGAAHAYVAASYGGVLSFDIADPKAPAQVGAAELPGSARRLALSGSLLYVAGWEDARVFDISDPGALRPITSESRRVASAGLAVGAVAAAPDPEVGERILIAAGTTLGTYQAFPERRAPNLRTDLDQVVFYNVATGDSRSAAVITRNDGNEPLVVQASVALDSGPAGSQFSVDPEPVVIEAGRAKSIEVNYRAGDADPAGARGLLTLTSSDPDRAEHTVALVGNGPKLAVGDPAPDIAIALLGGDELTTSAVRGHIAVLSYFSVF